MPFYAHILIKILNLTINFICFLNILALIVETKSFVNFMLYAFMFYSEVYLLYSLYCTIIEYDYEYDSVVSYILYKSKTNKVP